MSTEKENRGTIHVTSITSATSHLDIQDHEVNLNALDSNPLSIGDVGTSLTDTQKDFVLRRLHFDALVSFEVLPPQATFIFEKIEQMPVDEAVKILRKAVKEHEDDVNIFDQDVELWRRLVNYHGPQRDDHGGSGGGDASDDDNESGSLNTNRFGLYRAKEQQGGIVEKIGSIFHTVKEVDEKQTSTGGYDGGHDINDSSDSSDPNSEIGKEDQKHGADYYNIVDWDLQVRLEAVIVAYWSPYPQVRAVTDPFDDPTLPVETIRVYVISIIWMGIGAVINQFFTERYPSISLGMSVVSIFLYLSGRLYEYIIPKWKFNLFGLSVDLNPGPYSYKEQMLATIMCGVSSGTSYVSTNILMQKSEMFYGNQWVDFGYMFLLTASSQLMGFGLCFMMRKFAVIPVKAVWNQYLPGLKLNRVLCSPEKKTVVNGWKISGFNLFFITFGISFLYFWIPGYLFQALSQFNWMTWIAPDNMNLAIATGSFGGLGINPIPSFDFNVIGTAGFYYPFYSSLISYLGAFVSLFAVVGLYCSNYYNTAYIPINSNYLYTNEGHMYSVTDLVNQDSLFDNEKYQKIGPPFYSAANLVNYGTFFALYPFHFVYEVGTNYRFMWDALKSMCLSIRHRNRSIYDGETDPHSIMMRAYPEVPDWAYISILVISLVLAILCVKVYPAEVPVWGIFFALGINFVFLIPLTTVAARTGFSFGLNVLVELIMGYAVPGNGLALSFVKALGYNIDGQAQNWINDLKQGHYAKIPPRAMFRVQLLSVVLTMFIQLGILLYQINGIPDYCSPTNPQKFFCYGTTTFYNASILWGVIGPKRVFGGLYPMLKWCFLIGFVGGIICVAFKKLAPRKYTKYFEPSIFLAGFMSWAANNLSYSTGGLYLGFAFMHYVKHKYEAWWQKYSYLLGSGIDAGIAFAGIIIFFAVQYHEVDVNWWGNNVPYEGWDYQLRYAGSKLNATLDAPDGYFGPRKGHYP